MNAIDIVTPAQDTIEQIRAEVRLLMTDEGLNQADIARESGVPYGTFTPFMGGTYRGDNAGIAAKVSRWLETRRERQRTTSVLPVAPSFVATPTAAAILDVLGFAQAAPDFAVVVGGAGIGKTTAIEEYQRRNSNVFVVTGEPCMSSHTNMMTGIAESIGVIERNPGRLSKAIVARLKNAAALIVVDEAQHLSSAALDQLRTIHDLARCGIAVSGNESVFSRLQGGDARGAQFAQLHSRVGMRVVQPKARTKDMCALIAAWGIAGDSAEAKLLKTIAAKAGALRGMTKTLRLAGMLAGGAGEPLSAKHIRQAWGQLSSTTLDAQA